MFIDIPVSKLRPIAILADGDLYDLAVLVLRGLDACAASGRCAGGKRCPTPYSLARNFVALFPEVDLREVVEKLQKAEVLLDATVVPDERFVQPPWLH